MADFTAEVIDTSMAFDKNAKDDDGNPLPLGTILVQHGTTAPSGLRNKSFAIPVNSNLKCIPLIGEQVSITYAISDIANSIGASRRFYYSVPINVQGELNNNALPGQLDYSTSGGSDTSTEYSQTQGTPNKQSSGRQNNKLGATFEESTKVKSLQPFEGDQLFEGRWGQSIRFSSTIKGKTSIYDKKPAWTGNKSGDPITIIRNGQAPASGKGAFYVIEDFEKDGSSIWLTSTQTLDKTSGFKSSQKNYGLTTEVTPEKNYKSSQVVISADRLFFNSKTDYIILSGKKSVNIATPKWQMDMDKLFTILEETLQQLADLTSAKASFPTPTGGSTLPATNVVPVQKLLTELKSMAQ